jgi:uncharacterized protein (DUF1778 family)
VNEQRHPLALRIPEDKLAAIDARAQRAGLNRTEYMVRAALGEITNPTDAASRLDSIEERVAQLERWQRLSA